MFGYQCFPCFRPFNSYKLQPLSLNCIFLEYANQKIGYLSLEPIVGKLYISRHVLFDEQCFHSLNPQFATVDNYYTFLDRKHLLFPSRVPSQTLATIENEHPMPTQSLSVQPVSSIDHVPSDSAQATYPTTTLSLPTSPILSPSSPLPMLDGAQSFSDPSPKPVSSIHI